MTEHDLHLIEIGEKAGALKERAKIVAWLDDQHDIYNLSDNWSAYWAECIEAGEHYRSKANDD